ncbi:MAG TPA: M50 family metallopeptidase [Oligoflexia bacterium]|nr:M50 family metallopeptidase [Oligoflexia bacterium]HMP47271.1 M50 family metallopeptidase [Oligoflexia bacterium]
MDFLGGLPAFLILIGVVVTIHELGHFLAAKFCGVGVLKFSVGFGPAIIKKRFRETEYQLSIIPLGGFVRMVGDMPDPITGTQVSDSSVRGEDQKEDPDKEEVLPPEVSAVLNDRSKWFIEKKLWQKSLIVFAGPLFNFILAILLVITSVSIFGLLDADGTKMGDVLKGSPAELAGMLSGDEVISINGIKVSSFDDIQGIIHGSEGASLIFELRRVNSDKVVSNLELEIKPLKKSSTTVTGEKVTNFMIGVAPQLSPKKVSFGQGILRSFSWVGKTSYLVIEGIVGLFRGKVSMESLGGPILIYKVAGESAQKGANSFLMFLAYINITLGILNLLPIPVLDGGHLLMFAFEGVFGSISVRKKEVIQTIGLVFLVGIMVIAFKNDLTRNLDDLKEKELAWEDDEVVDSSSAKSSGITQ